MNREAQNAIGLIISGSIPVDDEMRRIKSAVLRGGVSADDGLYKPVEIANTAKHN